MSIKSKVLDLFETSKELTVKEIVDKLAASKQMVHIVLNQLIEDRIVEKLGRAPKTVYRLFGAGSAKTVAPVDLEITEKDREFLKKNFLAVTETGNLLEGIAAFDNWCKQRRLPVLKTLSEFKDTREKYAPYYDAQGNINGLDKLEKTKGYETIWLDDLYYLDLYAIERFGKTRLGVLLHYAKQGQNKYLMEIMMKETAERIRSFVSMHQADAIGFIPPTIRREVQIMKYIQTRLNIALPVIEIKKLSGIIPVPQKSLAKLDERIRNAENTFVVTDQRKFKNVILIDDAVGSGSTLNQIAGKIKNKDVARNVVGLAVVGSFKGFDVITDV